MEFLSDDPTVPAAALGLAALVCLVLLKVGQQGKYLIWAGVCAALLAALLLVERLWVTDAERIEAVVYGLAQAVAESDGDRAADFLDERCELQPADDRGNILVRIVSNHFAGPITRARLKRELPNYQFDYVRVARVTTHAGAMTRLGSAEFVVHIFGLQKEPAAGIATPPSGMGWALGLREAEPGVWKVTRITPGMVGDR